MSARSTKARSPGSRRSFTNFSVMRSASGRVPKRSWRLRLPAWNRGAEQLGGLGVEEGAVSAPGDRGDREAHELFVLVGDQCLAELHPLDKVPLGVDVVVRDLVDE